MFYFLKLFNTSFVIDKTIYLLVIFKSCIICRSLCDVKVYVLSKPFLLYIHAVYIEHKSLCVLFILDEWHFLSFLHLFKSKC